MEKIQALSSIQLGLSLSLNAIADEPQTPLYFSHWKEICILCSLAGKRKINFILTIIGSIVFITIYWNLSSIHFFKQDFKASTEYTQWTYDCDNITLHCNRGILKPNQNGQSRQTCQMTCGSSPLWPLPTGKLKEVNRKVIAFRSEFLKFRFLKTPSLEVKLRLIGAADIFLKNNLQRKPMTELLDPDVKDVDILMSIIGNNTATIPHLNIDESYKLEITDNSSCVSVSIKASTFFGARHALETLSQLIWFDDQLGLFRIISGIKFDDIPAFKYRGIMLDTASNFIPLLLIKQTLTAMSMNKMNTLHWYMTDEYSFPFCYIDCERAMYGAESFKKVYSTDDIKDIIDFASIRGIRVIVEIHYPEGISTIWNQNRNTNINQEPSSSNKSYNASKMTHSGNFYFRDKGLNEILYDINKLTGAPGIIHLGGEIINEFFDGRYEDINRFRSFKRLGFQKIFEAYQNVSHKIMQNNVTNTADAYSVVLWSGSFEQIENFTKVLDKKLFIAQVASESSTRFQDRLIGQGYRVIISHSDVWFLNRLPNWYSVYSHRPWQNYTTRQIDKVLGAEVCLWTENIDKNSLNTRLWPSAAAFAELVWSNPTDSARSVTERLQVQRQRMAHRAIMAAPIQPQWCSLNPGQCS